MKTQKNNPKVWIKPEIKVLSIKKDTFAGTTQGSENQQNKPGPPAPPMMMA